MKNKNLIIEQLVSKIVSELGSRKVIKESSDIDIVTDLKNKNQDLGNHLKGNDELGDFFIVKAPDEQSTPESIVIQTNIPDLMLKNLNGELLLNNIRYVNKKETSAMRNANKLIKEFGKELTISRKKQLSELINKRDGISKQLEGFLQLKKDKMIDEESNKKIELIREKLAGYDNQIVELQTKLKNKHV